MKNPLKITPGLEEMGTALNPYIETYPSGYNANVMAVSVKSSNPVASQNFIKGVPNVSVVTNPGFHYFYNGNKKPDRHYPSIYIPGYLGTPIPVVHPNSGELVAVLTNYSVWDPKNPTPPVNVIADDSDIGISTNDERYDIVLGGFFIENIGVMYGSDTMIELKDKDTEFYNGDVEPIIKGGRIVGVEIINTGSGYKRIPEVIITSKTGRDARLFPIMNVIAKETSDPRVKRFTESVEMVFCPSANRRGA